MATGDEVANEIDDGRGKAEERKGAAVKRVAQGPLRQKLNLAEAKIAKLTGLIEKVDSVLGNGSAFARDPDTGPG